MPAPVTAPFQPAAPPLSAAADAWLWRSAPALSIDRTWRGDAAPLELPTSARVCWTAEHLWVAFECGHDGLDVDAEPDPAVERHGLWERDVCEAFVQSPGEPGPESYKEFEVAPTGQWCDLSIRHPRRDVDVGWDGGMATAAAVDPDAAVWRAVIRVPFSAFGVAPRAGDAWRINLFRIGRVRGVRQYLAYAPTDTASPDFHVPGRFVPLLFTAGGRA